MTAEAQPRPIQEPPVKLPFGAEGILDDGSLRFGRGTIGPSEVDIQHADELFHQLTSDGVAVVDRESPVGDVLDFKETPDGAWSYQRPPTTKKLPRFIAIPAAAAMSLLLTACGTGIVRPGGETQVDTSKPPAPPTATMPAPHPTEGPYRVNIPITGRGSTLPPPIETPIPTATPDIAKTLAQLPVISTETLKENNITIEPMTAEDITDLQMKALEKGEVRLALPGDFMRDGGKMESGKTNKAGNTGLFLTQDKPGPFTFPSLIGGTVEDVIFSTSNVVRIKLPNGTTVSYYTAPDAIIKARLNETIKPGDPLFEGNYKPGSDAQKSFLKSPVPPPPNAVVLVTYRSDGTSAGNLAITSVLTSQGGIVSTQVFEK